MDDDSIKLYIPLVSYQKIMGYAKGCDKEITGFADVTYDAENHQLTVGEVYLLEQESAATEVEMGEEAIAKFTVACMEKGMTQLPRLWWHSHVDMGAFFSATDHQAIEDLLNDSYSVALVVNKKQEMRAALRLYKPVSMFFDELPIVIQLPEIKVTRDMEREIRDKVKPMKYPPVKTTTKENYYPKKTLWHKGHNVSDCNLSYYHCSYCQDYWNKEVEGVVKEYDAG